MVGVVASQVYAFEQLVRDARACRLCDNLFASTRTAHQPRPVFQPSHRARVCIASQAPGMRAHTSGTPFDDPSGERLRAWMGVDRATFYDDRLIAILPMGFCFPGYDAKGGDLPPPRICAETWRSSMIAAHPKIELMLLVGQYSQAWHLGAAREKSLTATVAAWRRYLEDKSAPVAADRRVLYFPTPHPSWRNNAWLKKNPWFEAEALPRLRAEIAKRLSVVP